MGLKRPKNRQLTISNVADTVNMTTIERYFVPKINLITLGAKNTNAVLIKKNTDIKQVQCQLKTLKWEKT